MNQRFDTILKSGTVVNQDGEGVARYRHLQWPDRRDRRAGTGLRRRGDRLQGPAHPARRDGHPGAFPRARPDPQGGSGDGIAQRRDGRGDGRVRNAEHRSADHHRSDLHRQGEARPSPHALRFRVLHRRHPRERAGSAGTGTRAGLCRRQGVHRLLHRRAAGRGRREPAADFSGDPAAAPRFMPRTNTASTSASRCASRATRARIRCGATRPRR